MSDKKEYRNYNVKLNMLLDDFGYNENDIKLRTYAYDKILSAENIALRDILLSNYFFAGSGSEGIGVRYESDFDVIAVGYDTFCVEDLGNVQNQSKFKQIYLVDRTNAPPGYCCLKTGDQFEEINHYKFISL